MLPPSFLDSPTTNSLKTVLFINMKTKRIKTTNSLRFSVYLPDECWELIFKHLLMNDKDYKSLSLVSKQFLSITNRLRSSLTIKSNLTTEQALNLIRRFPKLTSLNFIGRSDLDYILPQLDTFPFRLKSLKLSKISTIPATGLLEFSITSTLNSLTCSYTDFLHSSHMFLISDCFPELHRIDLSHCKHIYPDTLHLLLKPCRKNITHLNLTACSILTEDMMMNFRVPKLKVLNLSRSTVDDQTLNVITKSCTGILKLSLKHCDDVGYKGVKCVLQNCKKLREINLKHCPKVVRVNVDSMLLRRPSLRKIKLPSGVAWVAPLVSTKS
ncbi:F-box/LRR-repeat protein [Trifolium pratense]|uniref:F-box/LRR-repeat protein n=1 Tax=Trifolium pratense TaxID=57577 RepID=A0A2K3NMD9_TRIPR|nr:F-box/LRR-repeat protein [Trifolium pratense]